MTTLLKRMHDDMKLRNLAASTQASYAQHVSMLARHFDRSPDMIAPEEIRSYQLYLSTEKKSAPATVAIAVSALRFLYGITLRRSWVMEEMIPMPKRPEALPTVLSPDEVVEFLECVPLAKHRAILMSCYAAGLRVSEVIRLKPGDIDTRRMVIGIEQGKGRRDRYVMLSNRLANALERWQELGKPKTWLFQGSRPQHPITRHAVAVHMLENGTDIRTIQLLLGHRNIAATAHYLRLATTQVCSTTSPLDLLPRVIELPTQI